MSRMDRILDLRTRIAARKLRRQRHSDLERELFLTAGRELKAQLRRAKREGRGT